MKLDKCLGNILPSMIMLRMHYRPDTLVKAIILVLVRSKIFNKKYRDRTIYKPRQCYENKTNHPMWSNSQRLANRK